MTKYYENGFFLEQNAEKTRLEISDEKWKDLLNAQAQGKEITLQNGELVAKDVAPNYRAQRLSAYPEINDFLDAFVKKESGDPALIKEGEQQLKEYVAACLSVKAKYPKQ